MLQYVQLTQVHDAKLGAHELHILHNRSPCVPELKGGVHHFAFKHDLWNIELGSHTGRATFSVDSQARVGRIRWRKALCLCGMQPPSALGQVLGHRQETVEHAARAGNRKRSGSSRGDGHGHLACLVWFECSLGDGLDVDGSAVHGQRNVLDDDGGVEGVAGCELNM
jgi:hypothetical protein